jgi:hypothetical protein
VFTLSVALSLSCKLQQLFAIYLFAFDRRNAANS